MTTWLDHHQPTARVVHRCTWCGRNIPRGEQYQRSTGIGDHGFFTQWAHLRCFDLLMRYASHYALEEDEPIEWAEVLAWEREADQ